MKTPHFLRFAQSLALGASVTAALAGCGSSTSPDASSPDVAQADTATPSDVAVDSTVTNDANPCASCQCVGLVPPDSQTGDSGVPACTGDQLGMCCAAIGPLPPPELSA
jgi:hypothetical protein